MKDNIVWILTLSLLIAVVVLFYYAMYYFFGTIGIFAFIALTVFWLLLIQNNK